MERVVVNEDFESDDEKRADFREKIRSGLNKARDWVVDNREVLVVVVPAAASVICYGIKTGVKRSNLRKEATLKNLYCYDRSLGHYWRLRRELSNREWLTIEARRKMGERLADILADMRVLK